MPHRMLTMAETAEHLHLTSADLERLVKNDEIPFERQGTRVTFRHKDVDVWASRRILGLPGKALRDYHQASSARIHAIALQGPLVPQCMTVERIDPELHSRTRGSVLRDMVALAESTDLVSDPRELLNTLEERERLCSTALPGGVALLHPRNHDPYMFADSFIVLGRSLQPIHFGSQDGTSTDLFFLVCCQDDRIHLHALARLCTMYQQTDLLAALRVPETAAGMMQALVGSEDAVLKAIK